MVFSGRSKIVLNIFFSIELLRTKSKHVKLHYFFEFINDVIDQEDDKMNKSENKKVKIKKKEKAPHIAFVSLSLPFLQSNKAIKRPPNVHNAHAQGLNTTLEVVESICALN